MGIWNVEVRMSTKMPGYDQCNQVFQTVTSMGHNLLGVRKNVECRGITKNKKHSMHCVHNAGHSVVLPDHINFSVFFSRPSIKMATKMDSIRPHRKVSKSSWASQHP